MAKRFIHSLSTRPLRLQSQYGVDAIRRLASNICYFSLSVAYIKRLGLPIALHTDTFGAAVLAHLPYDEVLLTLDDMPSTAHPRFWAAGKMWAIEADGPGCVHIDGDLFVKKADLADRILNTPADAVVQNFESGEWNRHEAERFRPISCGLAAEGICTDSMFSFNTGILGINNPDLMAEYIRRYKLIVATASRDLADNLDADSGAVPDLVAEQANFFQCCRQMKMTVEEILPPFGSDYSVCKDMGLQHVLGDQKFNHLPQCLATLKKINPDIHRKTVLLCKNLIPDLPDESQ